MTDQQRNATFVMSDGWYNFLKRLVQVIIPAFGTFYVTLGQTWNFPRPDDVATTCLALAAFLGICLGISNAQYNASGKGFDGNLTMQPPGPEGPARVTGLSLDGLATEDLEGKKSITLKVKQEVPVGPPDIEENDVEEEPVIPPHKTKATRPIKKASPK